MLNIKISRVKHNLFLEGMEFSYIFFRLPTIPKDYISWDFLEESGVRTTDTVFAYTLRFFFSSSVS